MHHAWIYCNFFSFLLLCIFLCASAWWTLVMHPHWFHRYLGVCYGTMNFGHAFTYSPPSTWSGNKLILWPLPHFNPMNFGKRGGFSMGHLLLSKDHALSLRITFSHQRITSSYLVFEGHLPLPKDHTLSFIFSWLIHIWCSKLW